MAKHSLKQPLLDNEDQPPVLPPSTYNGSESQGLAEEPKGEFKTWLVEELTHQFWLAGPMILVNLLQYLLNVVSVMFVGHLGELALASSSIATSLAGVTGYHVMVSFSHAQSSLLLITRLSNVTRQSDSHEWSELPISDPVIEICFDAP